MTQDSVSDELLLEGFCAGNEECAGRFVRHFWRRLSWIAFGIVGDSGWAEMSRKLPLNEHGEME